MMNLFANNTQAAAKNERVFTAVSYRQFRQHLADFHCNTVKGKGFETVIYDSKGDIQAIMHAASIDEEGQCYPAEYFVRSSALPQDWTLAA